MPGRIYNPRTRRYEDPSTGQPAAPPAPGTTYAKEAQPAQGLTLPGGATSTTGAVLAATPGVTFNQGAGNQTNTSQTGRTQAGTTRAGTTMPNAAGTSFDTSNNFGGRTSLTLQGATNTPSTTTAGSAPAQRPSIAAGFDQLPPDVAQTVLAQRASAPAPASVSAPGGYGSAGNFNTARAADDYAKGKIGAGQLSGVYDAASAAGNQQGAGISPATQAEMRGTASVAQQIRGSQDAQAAANAASRRQPGGSPYGMVPVAPGQSFDTHVSDGQTSFNGTVYPQGTSITLGPGGRTIIGQAPAAPANTSTTAQPAAAAPPASSAPAASAGLSDYKAQEQAALKAYPAIGVAGSPENRSFVQAFNTGGADKSNVIGLANSLFGQSSQNTASPAVPAATPQTPALGTSTPAPSGPATSSIAAGFDNPALRGFVTNPGTPYTPVQAGEAGGSWTNDSPGTVAGLAVRTGLGNAVGAVRSGGSNAVDSTLGAVGSGMTNTADFARAVVGLPPTDPVARQTAAVDAVKSYPANNPGASSQVQAPGTTSSGNIAGGYDLSAYGIKPPGTTGPAPNTPAAPAAPGTNAAATGSLSSTTPASTSSTSSPPAVSTTGLPSTATNARVLANAGIGAANQLPSVTTTNPTTVPTDNTFRNPAVRDLYAAAGLGTGTAPADAAGTLDAPSATPAVNAPSTTTVTTPAGTTTLDSTNPFAGGRSPFTLQSSAAGTNAPAGVVGGVTPGKIAAGFDTATSGSGLSPTSTTTQTLANAPGYGLDPASQSAQPAALGKSALYQPPQSSNVIDAATLASGTPAAGASGQQNGIPSPKTINAGIGAAGTLQSQGYRNIDLGNNGVPVAGTNATGQRVDLTGGPSTVAGQALNKAADPSQALNAAPTADQALANAPTAGQTLARPGQQTDTGGPVSDASSTLNKRTDADQALNPGAPSTAGTPGTGNSLLNSTAPTADSASRPSISAGFDAAAGTSGADNPLGGSKPFNLQGTAGATDPSGYFPGKISAGFDAPTTNAVSVPGAPGAAPGGANPAPNMDDEELKRRQAASAAAKPSTPAGS